MFYTFMNYLPTLLLLSRSDSTDFLSPNLPNDNFMSLENFLIEFGLIGLGFSCMFTGYLLL